MNELISGGPAVILAALSGEVLLKALIWVVIGAVIFWLGNWMIGYIGVGEPFNKVAKVILAVIAVVFLVNALLMIVGRPFIAL